MMRWQHLMPDLTPFWRVARDNHNSLPTSIEQNVFGLILREVSQRGFIKFVILAYAWPRLMNVTLPLTIADDATVRKLYGEENSPKLIFRGWTFWLLRQRLMTQEVELTHVVSKTFCTFQSFLGFSEIRESCLLSKLGLIWTEQAESLYHFCLQ